MPLNIISRLAANARPASSRRIRSGVLSLLLLALLAQTIDTSSPTRAAVYIALGAGYLILIWAAELRLNGARAFSVLVAALWAGTAAASLALDESYTIVVLLYFLVGAVAYRQSGNVAAALVAGIIAADAAFWLLTGTAEGKEIVTYSLMHAGLFGLIVAIRLRREARAARAAHVRELGDMHAKLEQAHLELQRAHRELEEAAVRSLRYAVSEERTRIARDIHDSIGHGLTSVIVQLQTLPYMIQANPADAEQALGTVLGVARDCLTEVRSVVHRMARDDAGLGLIALKSLAKLVQEQSRLDIRFDVAGEITPWSPEASETLYRVLQEALTNVIRHANASAVDIRVQESACTLTMIVADNGPFAADVPPAAGFGISGMRARCEAAGGTLAIRPRLPYGIELEATIPLSSETGREASV